MPNTSLRIRFAAFQLAPSSATFLSTSLAEGEVPLKTTLLRGAQSDQATIPPAPSLGQASKAAFPIGQACPTRLVGEPRNPGGYAGESPVLDRRKGKPQDEVGLTVGVYPPSSTGCT